mmetsp:Transcript_11710/g.38741  ORF Transcript_11710/g.38741 Transcript_11710/m.38741 type:complete len:191 (-) Transcript_11710:78-650(-)|eukprot:CAMPEP_0196704854 /NCGR_PEP_ID=MMETSP1090-20130531/58748_1 /TAXON_ID=37098 /ORGANISM="Isochrysis sp, Strain CCMP1244" /LENGTH=190 /DNA_ID=CAMNT_0042044751 /DNA_START=38 /DNA_END=610 /DNA_ORIENTATION=-
MSAKAKKLPPLPKLCGSQPQLYLRADGQGVTRGAASGASSSQPAQPALGSGFVGGADAGGGSKGIRARRREKPDTAGAGWGNMRAPEMTAEVKRELLMVRMRGALDPKRFYRTSDMKKELPKYFQMGTVVEGTGEGRTRTAKGGLFDQVLNDGKLRKRAKSQFRKVQQATMAGVKKRPAGKRVGKGGKRR